MTCTDGQHSTLLQSKHKAHTSSQDDAVLHDVSTSTNTSAGQPQYPASFSRSSRKDKYVPTVCAEQ
jgi:hypothetical protein